LLTMAVAPLAVGLLGYRSLRAIDRDTEARSARLAPRVALLEQLQIFQSARRPVLERLAADATEVAIAAGAAIVREGERAEALYVLVEGEVLVSARGEGGGPERELRRMSAPDYFGEIGVLGRIARTATVTAAGPCRVDRIDGDALLEALTSTPPSSSMMENARSRLVVTHPSHEPRFVGEGG